MDSELNLTLTKIRSYSLEMLKLIYQESIPSELALPTALWKSYGDEKLAIMFRACLAIWATSGKKIVPNEFQLTATISLISGQDTLVDVYQVPLSCFFLSQRLSVPRWKGYVKDMVQALEEVI